MAPAAAMGRMSFVLVCTTTPVMPKSTSDLASPNSFFTFTCSASAVGGTVFGMSTTVVMPPQTAAVEPVVKSSLWVMPGSRKCTWPSNRPGKICLPLTSISSLPWGRESSEPMATITSLLIATPPLNVASGVTTQPFFITRSAAMILPFFWVLSFVGFHDAQPADRLALLEIGHRVFLAGLDVLAQDGDGLFGVALLDRREHLKMLLMRRQTARRIVKPVGAALEHDALEDVAQGVGQRFVAGELGDRQVHVLIEDQPLAGEAVLHVAAVGIHLVAQARERGIGEIGDGLFDRERFERFAQLVKLLGLLHSNFFAGKTAVRKKGDVSFLNQSRQCFAHRSAAHAEAFAQLLMMQLLSRHYLVAKNQILDLVVNAG